VRRGWLRSNRRQTLGQRGPAGYPPRVLLLILTFALLGWSLGAEALNRESATLPGRFCPAFLLSWAECSYRLGTGALQSLPDLGRLFQIEVLTPPTGLAGSPRTPRWAGRLRSWKLGTLLAERDTQVPVAESNRHRTVPALLDPHDFASQSSADVLACDLVNLRIQLDGVIVVHPPAFHVAENRRQIMLLFQRPVSIVGTGRQHRQSGVDPGQKLGFQIVVGLFQSCGFSHAHPFHQPVLSGSKTALHPPFGLGAVRRYPGDCQLPQRPTDLRRRHFHRVLLRSGLIAFAFLRRLKEARLVGIKCQRSPVLFHVALQQAHVFRRRVAAHKASEPPAGRIVNHVDQQDLCPASFQPIMVAGVPLHQFSKTAAAWAPFMDLLDPLLACSP